MISSEISVYLVFHWPTAIEPHLHWQEQSWIYKMKKQKKVNQKNGLCIVKCIPNIFKKKYTKLLYLPRWGAPVGRLMWALLFRQEKIQTNTQEPQHTNRKTKRKTKYQLCNELCK